MSTLKELFVVPSKHHDAGIVTFQWVRRDKRRGLSELATGRLVGLT